jgi:hypothetical protein
VKAILQCPECFARVPGETCDCSGSVPPVAIPRGALTSILHVTAVRPDVAPQPWEVLDPVVCDGPLIHPVRLPSRSRSAARQRFGNSIWLYRLGWCDLPLDAWQHGMPKGTGRLARLLGRSSFLLLDVTDDSLADPAFDTLLSVIDLWRLSVTAVAITGPDRAVKEACARVSTVCPAARHFPETRAGLAWLLGQLAHHSHPPSPAVADGQTHERKAAPRTVSVLDVGGQVAWHWFGRLQSVAANRSAPHAAARLKNALGSWVTRLERRWTGQVPTTIRFDDGRTRARRAVSGEWASGTEEFYPFGVVYTPEADSAVPAVVGIGPLAFLGGRELAALLHAVSSSGVSPRALIRDTDTNPTLWRWAIAEFPAARTFSMSNPLPQRVLRCALEAER